MSGKMFTFDPKSTRTIILGSLLEGGAGDDAVIYKYNTDPTSYKQDADGNTIRILSNDKSGEITLKLMSNAPLNDLLLLENNLISAGDKDRTISIASYDDNTGRTAIAETCGIKTPPSFSTSHGEMVWVFYASNIKFTPATKT